MARKAPKVTTPKASKSKDTKYTKGGSTKAKIKSSTKNLGMPHDKVKLPKQRKIGSSTSSATPSTRRIRNIKPETTSERSLAMRRANEYVKQGYSRKEALQMSWSEIKQNREKKVESERNTITEDQIQVNKLIKAIDDAQQTSDSFADQKHKQASGLTAENATDLKDEIYGNTKKDGQYPSKERAEEVMKNIEKSGHTIDELCEMLESLVVAFYNIDEAIWMGIDLHERSNYDAAIDELKKCVNG